MIRFDPLRWIRWIVVYTHIKFTFGIHLMVISNEGVLKLVLWVFRSLSRFVSYSLYTISGYTHSTTVLRSILTILIVVVVKCRSRIPSSIPRFLILWMDNWLAEDGCIQIKMKGIRKEIMHGSYPFTLFLFWNFVFKFLAFSSFL